MELLMRSESKWKFKQIKTDFRQLSQEESKDVSAKAPKRANLKTYPVGGTNYNGKSIFIQFNTV